MQRRPVGVLVAAIVLGLATCFLLLGAFGSVFTAVVAPHIPMPPTPTGATPPSPGLMMGAMLFLAMVYLGLAAWAVSTLTGLVRMKSWSRISIIVIGAGLVVVGVVCALSTLAAQTMLPSMPLPPGTDAHSLRTVFVLFLLMSLAMVAVGIWWIVYFSLRRTREAFRQTASPQTGMPGWPATSPQRHSNAPRGPLTDFTVAQPLEDVRPPEDAQPADETSSVQAAPPTAQVTGPVAERVWRTGGDEREGLTPLLRKQQPKRPVSMTVLSILLLLGSFFSLLQMTSPVPVFLCGAVLSGWPAHITMLMFCAVSGVAGMGLLRLQKPAWGLAVGLICSRMLNGLAMMLPWSRGRYVSLIQTISDSSQGGMAVAQFGPKMLSMAAALSGCFTLLVGGVLLFLLWRARHAFVTSAETQAAA